MFVILVYNKEHVLRCLLHYISSPSSQRDAAVSIATNIVNKTRSRIWCVAFWKQQLNNELRRSIIAIYLTLSHFGFIRVHSVNDHAVIGQRPYKI